MSEEDNSQMQYAPEHQDVEYEGVNNFFNDYINSPKYKERLESSGYENPDQVIKGRSNALKNTDVWETVNGSHTDVGGLNIKMDSGDSSESDLGTVYAHETGHITGGSYADPILHGEEGDNVRARQLNYNDAATLNFKNKMWQDAKFMPFGNTTPKKQVSVGDYKGYADAYGQGVLTKYGDNPFSGYYHPTGKSTEPYEYNISEEAKLELEPVNIKSTALWNEKKTLDPTNRKDKKRLEEIEIEMAEVGKKQREIKNRLIAATSQPLAGKKEGKSHDIGSEEAYGDLQGLRYWAKKNLNYNPTEDMTSEKWEAMLNLYNKKGKPNLIMERMIKRYGEDGKNIIDIMNTVADKGESDTTNYAKNGGWLDTFEEGGYTSASINVPPRRKTTTENPYKFLYDPSILDTSNTALPAESTMVDTQRNVPTEYDIDAIVENVKQQEAADINYKKNYYELERQKEIKGSEKSTKIDKINNIGALNKKELIDVQRALVDKGYLNSPDLEINSKDKDAVSKLQKMLVDKDYDLGKYGPNKDGVDGLFGRKTKAALSKYNYEKEIDGVIGPKTELAFSQYKKDKGREKNTLKSLNIPLDFIEGKDLQSRLQNKNYFKNKIEDFNLNTDNILIKSEKGAFKINSEKKCTAEHCSQYVGEEIEKKVKATGRENVGAFGDAWTIHTNLMGAGAKEIYNVFPDVKPSINNPEQYIKNLTKLTPMVSPEDLKSGDVVNMYYGGSTNHSKAYEKGHKVFSTHVGIIKEDIDGNKYVEHNVGSKIYKEPLLKILNNKSTTKTGKPLRITAITRPQYNIQTFDGIYEPTQSQINFDKVRNPKTSFSKKESAEFVQTLINNKKPLLKDIPISSPEMDNLIKAARVLQWKESNVTPQPKKDNTRWLSELRENVGIRESSEGYTQMKDEENLNPVLRENLKIDNSALENPKTAAIATIYALSTKYIQIKSSIKDLNKYTDDEIAQLAVISWNEPVDMVIKTANKYGNLQEVVQAYKDDYGYNKKGGTEFPYDLTLTAYNRYLK